MKIGLFIPCFVNAVYPQVGTASFKLLRSLGVDVDYPLGQTCCGQPMANGGFEKDSAPLARNMEKLFKDYDYVVGPSGSCVAFVKEHYPEILHKEAHECLSSRIYEICEFIHDVVRPTELPRAHFPHKGQHPQQLPRTETAPTGLPLRTEHPPLFQAQRPAFPREGHRGPGAFPGR